MSEEDDWFERALRETDEASDGRPAGRSESDSDDEDPESDGSAAGSDSAGSDAVDAEFESDDTESGLDDPAREIGIGSDDAGDEPSEGDPFGGDVDGDDAEPETVDDPATDDPTNGGVPAEAFGDVDEAEFDSFGDDGPFGGGTDVDAGNGDGAESAGSDDVGPFGEDDLFGGSRGGGSGSGAGGAGGGGADADAGTDPFGGYRGSTSGGDEFGFEDFGGDAGDGEAADFDVDPDEFESEIERTDIGIGGLDDMILGGVPSRSLLSVIGGAGTGKTTFALQFLNQALETGNKGIYITLEQSRESIFDTADEKGWSFREHANEDRLAVVAIDPIEMANSLSSIRNDLVRLIAEFDADRLVLDSVSLLEMMYDHPAKRRSEVFGFTRSLKEAGVTTLLTSEASEQNPYASRHGIVEYLTDAVFVLQYIRGSDFRETRLAVEIQKIRDANHSRETKPYDITDTGISVYDQANIF
ncbi:KaiC domain-containing protein [Halorubrum sp. BOL3-1]|uniref:KaiC domain-containing protein n=1 Tax=Halorubrum sp. BOL3-1 TaxID=2497325 RepID=UPI0010050037|nr:KaiC domain-containing protein [Halorubrum sp. BOL3-1]QAU11711.1 KaiC domain-containing protein [Halorubrum sp. BOL3-1]